MGPRWSRESAGPQCGSPERVYPAKLVSHLRLEIFNDFAASIAWHDLLAIATCSGRPGGPVALLTTSCHAQLSAKSLGISCRDCDIAWGVQNRHQTRCSWGDTDRFLSLSLSLSPPLPLYYQRKTRLRHGSFCKQAASRQPPLWSGLRGRRRAAFAWARGAASEARAGRAGAVGFG